MVNHEPYTDPVEASRDFDRRLRESPAYIDMDRTLKRRTIFGIVLAIWAAINVALSILAITAASNANHAVSQSGKALSQQHEQCLAGNTFRRNDYKTWLFVENFLAPEPRTPEIQAKVDIFQKHFEQADKLRDCEKVK